MICRLEQLKLTHKQADRRMYLFFILGGIFVGNALLSELIGPKIFDANKLFPSVEPPQLGQFKFSFIYSVGILTWPVVFIFTDLINDYFGRKGVQFISWFTSFLLLFVFGILAIVTHLPPADFWLDDNATAANGSPFNINYAFSVLFGQGNNIIVGSLIAFLIGQLIDAYTFQFFKRKLGGENSKIWLRATLSTLISQLFDSFIVLWVAFHVLGSWSMETVITVGINQYIFKCVAAIVMIPVLYVVHYFADRFLGKSTTTPSLSE